MNTLLVIDMQNAWLKAGAPCLDKDGVVERINRMARHLRERGGQVIHIRHSNEQAAPNSVAWQIDPAIECGAPDLAIDKRACDAFAGTALLDQLRALGTRTVYVSGFATEFCVDTTVRAALSHGFDVVALADAHTTRDRPHLAAPRIVEHHNWIWADLAPPAGGTIALRSVAQAIAELPAAPA